MEIYIGRIIGDKRKYKENKKYRENKGFKENREFRSIGSWRK